MNPLVDYLLRHQLQIVWGLFILISVYGIGMWIRVLRKPSKRTSKWT